MANTDTIKKIKQIEINNQIYEIVPHRLTDGTYFVNLPTLTKDNNTLLLRENVVDNLISTAIDLPLSANQGRILDKKKQDSIIYDATNGLTVAQAIEIIKLFNEKKTINIVIIKDGDTQNYIVKRILGDESSAFILTDVVNFIGLTGSLITTNSNLHGINIIYDGENVTINEAEYPQLPVLPEQGPLAGNVPFIDYEGILQWGSLSNFLLKGEDGISVTPVSEGISGPAIIKPDATIARAADLNNKADKIHTHTTKEVKHYYLDNWADSVSAIDAAKFNTTRACRTAFLPASCINIEYSTDNGLHWIDYGSSNSEKENLFSMSRTSWLNVAKKTSEERVTTDHRIRITIESADRYLELNQFTCWFSTSGHDCKCDIECSYRDAPEKFISLRQDVTLGGWSGFNVINFKPITFGGYSGQESGHVKYLRVIFKITKVNSNLSISNNPNLTDLRFFGTNTWITPNNMMQNDSLFNWDYLQNAFFPAQITTSGYKVKNKDNDSVILAGGGTKIMSTFSTATWITTEDPNIHTPAEEKDKIYILSMDFNLE